MFEVTPGGAGGDSASANILSQASDPCPARLIEHPLHVPRLFSSADFSADARSIPATPWRKTRSTAKTTTPTMMMTMTVYDIYLTSGSVRSIKGIGKASFSASSIRKTAAIFNHHNFSIVRRAFWDGGVPSIGKETVSSPSLWFIQPTPSLHSDEPHPIRGGKGSSANSGSTTAARRIARGDTCMVGKQ